MGRNIDNNSSWGLGEGKCYAGVQNSSLITIWNSCFAQKRPNYRKTKDLNWSSITAVTPRIFNFCAFLNFGLYLLINIILKTDKNVPILRHVLIFWTVEGCTWYFINLLWKNRPSWDKISVFRRFSRSENFWKIYVEQSISLMEHILDV